MNADGYKDILVGSFEGGPFLIKGSKEGFAEPDYILDESGEAVVIAAFWNHDEEKWDETDRADSEGHCTSASAVDWDNDGDMDLILGDYYGGRLFLRKNDGSAEEPSFAKTNVAIEADGEPMVIANGLAAPCVVDWNGDGLFDILCGGSKGGVFYFQNTGNKETPQFAAAVNLIEPLKSDGFIKRVPAIDGQPTMPGSSYHIVAKDYDADGDLDLLVGGRSSWLSGPIKVLSDEEKEAALKNKEIMGELMSEIQELMSDDMTADERKEVTTSDEYRELMDKYREASKESAKYKTDPMEQGDFVWLFRRN